MTAHEILRDELIKSYSDGNRLNFNGLSRDDVEKAALVISKAASDLLMRADSRGRINSGDIVEIWSTAAAKVFGKEAEDEPEGGWLAHTYDYLRNRLFPHIPAPEDSEKFEAGRLSLLKFMRAVYEYERKCCEFDPILDILLLSDEEIREKSFINEYIKMKALVRENYIYEFMRIGAEITPFNTLGHISGVHYVAMYAARQLYKAGVTVDLALISAAAASHDIGKYGCRKHEERRVPYLHYYYTDYCLGRCGLKQTAHIAANHSTWDLELEDLSVESLLLIYSDFRTKSTRENGREIIHFYSLREAFDVILSKLDNVDEAKRLRYARVYNKLKDFEDYMIEHGVHTDIADCADSYPRECTEPVVPVRREYVLLDRSSVTEQIKYRAIDHNIRVMHRFGSEQLFSGLVEAARSETDWKNVRTYITILREYSTYMTDSQKALALRYLYDNLAHPESDIREQTADTMGYIVSKYREEYKKELPGDIPAPDDNITNISLFREYLALMLDPDRKYTEAHRKWITASTDFFVRAVTGNCRTSCIPRYFDILENYYMPKYYLAGSKMNDAATEEKIIVLMNTALVTDAGICTASFRKSIYDFARNVSGKVSKSVDLIALEVLEHYGLIPSDEYDRRVRKILDLSEGIITDEQMSAMFLDNLKLHVTWNTKMANIKVMKQNALEKADQSRLMQIATHFSNLIKVSETVTVRKEAGRALLDIAGRMTMDKRNELMLELFNGLERNDYQFSGLIPDYLGIVLLYLDPEELDEVIYEMGKMIDSGTERAAEAALDTLAIALENYTHFVSYRTDFTRRNRILGLIMKGAASGRETVAREAIRALGVHIFGSSVLTLDEKRNIASHCFKRILTIMPDASASSVIDFYNNAASLNHIYRYITEYRAEKGSPDFAPDKPAVFFPGTFDPFSLGHKAIATTIRDMGFDVFLAIDEFSWSKKTIPHMLRRNILQMSIADEEGLYIFPDDIPVNIANPRDLGYLRSLFPDRELYVAVGSDVVLNASAYRREPEENSIHTFNHIVFAREARRLEAEGTAYPVTGKVINLTLDKFYEDISSTKIRENVDLGRDISDLIDLSAQNYIYGKSLYVREPAYKHEVQARELNIHTYEPGEHAEMEYFLKEFGSRSEELSQTAEFLSRPDIRRVTIETAGGRLSASAGAKRVRTSELMDVFGDIDIASYIRSNAGGEIAVIGAFYVAGGENVSYLRQILLTELLTSLIAKDYSYAVFYPADVTAVDPLAISTVVRQGFINISSDPDKPVYAVDMRNPIALFRDADTVIKAPLNKNQRVQKAFDKAHENLLAVLRSIYPGKLLLSFNTSAVYSKIVDLVAATNGVSVKPDPMKKRGPYIAVPFGKALSDVVVPNTVTKALRTEKYFRNDLHGFDVRESRDYLTLDEQAGTIRSFARPVILIDDLLHSGQRMSKVESVLRQNEVEVHKVIVGLLTGKARDRMKMMGRDIESAYFLPSISMWMNERDCYPFIGGDSIDSPDTSPESGDIGSEEGEGASVNLILPYTGFSFVGGGDPDSIYRYSLTCLENALSILRVIEEEYQKTFEKKLTLRRLGAVITNPRMPLLGQGLDYDDHIVPSVYVDNELRRLKRLFMFRHKQQQ